MSAEQQPPTADGTGEANTGDANAAPVDPRPRPAYGEYAPEGWQWTPPGENDVDHGANAAASRESSAGSEGAGVGSFRTPPAPPTSSASPAGSGPVPGVPHNLGARGSAGSAAGAGNAAPQAPSQAHGQAQTPWGAPGSAPENTTRQPGDTQQAGDQQHYRAMAPPQTQPGGTGGAAGSGGASNRLGDRIASIVLLVLGALGALYFAASLYSMPASISLMARALEIDGFAVPSSVSTTGTVGALSVFAIYALNLIFTLQRLRARKLAFWVPLVAAALAIIVVLGVSAIAIAQVPELLQQLSDPDSTARLLDYFATLG